MEDLISVLVPVYNARVWLQNCLDSIASQTWGNWEAVLVDDGSSDGSAEICDAMAAGDPRFRVLHQRNMGVSAARNAALDAAAGKYVYFIDADDCMHPRALELLHSAICSGPYRMASGEFSWADSDVRSADGPLPEAVRTVISSREGFMSCLERASRFVWLVVWNKLIDKSLLENIRFDDIAQEDVLFMARIYMETDMFVHLDVSLYSYLRGTHGLSEDKEYMGLLSELIVKTYMYRYASGNPGYQGLILRKTYKRFLVCRYRARNREEAEHVTATLRPFIKEHWKDFFASRAIPLADKLQCPVFYACPWLMRLVLKLYGN